jgi:D-alanine transaminase
MTVYLNGEFLPIEQAKISVLDRGFIFGDGVYEVIPVYTRRPFRLAEHLVRLQTSLDAIRLPNPYPASKWTELVGKIIAGNPWGDQNVYLQITRGAAKRDHAFPKGVQPTVFMMASELVPPTAELVRSGAKAIVLPDFRWLRCDIKSVSLLGNCMLRTLAADQGCAEAILVRDGMLTEASASNVFIVNDGTVLSPPKSHLILPGITYDVVLEILRENSIAHEVRPVTEATSLRRRSLGDLLFERGARHYHARRQARRRRQARPARRARPCALPAVQSQGHACPHPCLNMKRPSSRSPASSPSKSWEELRPASHRR